MKNKTCIIILGMHRSGTSALAGALSMCGISFGKTVMLPSFDNPKGFYENDRMVTLNEKLFQLLKRNWDSLDPLPFDWLAYPEIPELIAEGTSVIEKEFGSSTLFAIKDPRLCLLLPFWKQVFAKLGIGSRFLINLRDPHAIVNSLVHRNGFSIAKSHLLVMLHNIAAISYTSKEHRSWIIYDDFIQYPVDTVRRILNELDLYLELSYDQQRLISEYVDPQLKHFQTTAKTNLLGEEPSLFSCSIEQYTTLLSHITNQSELTNIDFDTYNKWLTRYPNVKLEHNRIAMLYVRPNESYENKYTKTKIISDQQLQWYLNLAIVKDGIIELCLVPANEAVTIQIEKLEFSPDQDKSAFEIRTNAVYERANQYVFDIDQPRIFIKFHKRTQLRSLSIQINYITDNRVNHHTDKLKTRPLWMQAIWSIIKSPITLIKNINADKIRTLRSALKRESPRQIVKNFIKLLNRTDSQEALLASVNNKNDNHPFSHKTITNPNAIVILYIVPSLPEYDTSSGGRRATELLKLMATHAHVGIFSLSQSSVKYSDYFTAFGITIVDKANYRVLKEIFPVVDVLVFAWYYTFDDAKKLVTLYPNAQKVIDTIDIHWIRESRSIDLIEGLTPERVAKNKKREIEAYSLADQVWVVSEADGAAVRDALPNANIHVVSNIHAPITAGYKDSNNNVITFIGGYNHYPNLSAVQQLATEIFPIIKKAVPDAVLNIAGSNAPEEVVELGRLKGVNFLGFVKEEELSKLYEDTFICMVPLKAGAGVKGKITEAISYRVPVLTNDIGNEGIHLIHGESGFLATSTESFAQLAIAIMKREYDLNTITEKAVRQLQSLVGIEQVRKRMLASLFPPIDICIVTYNKLDFLKKCLDSIWNHTLYPNYHVIVYSNSCTDGTRAYLELLGSKNDKLSYIYAEENEVFVRPNNTMMHYHDKSDIVLLNNDTEVTSGWLNGLYRTAYRYDRTGIVGATILYPDGVLQEFGSVIYEDGTGMNIGKGEADLSDPAYAKNKASSYVSGCAMYIKRSTINEIGTFDDDFHPCFFEDSDYCYRAWQKNIHTLVCSTAIVYHHEGASAGRDENEGFKSFQKINRQKFLNKHAGQIAAVNKRVKDLNKQLK